MNQKLLAEIIRNLQAKVRCPACGYRFGRTDIKFKGKLKQVLVFEFGCPICSTSLFAKVLVNQVLPNIKRQAKPARLKDVSPIREYKLPREKISTNDIIKAHQELELFDGDLTKLFS